MGVIEEEILARFKRLDEPGKRRVLALLAGELSAPLSQTEWLQQVYTFREQLRMKYGETNWFGAQAMLDEVREAASWPRWSS